MQILLVLSLITQHKQEYNYSSPTSLSGGKEIYESRATIKTHGFHPDSLYKKDFHEINDSDDEDNAL